MNYLEIIRLRTRRQLRTELVERLQEAIDESPQEIHLLWHTAIETDLCLLIPLDFSDLPSNLGAVGFQLTAALKEFGIVDHSAWLNDLREVKVNFQRK